MRRKMIPIWIAILILGLLTGCGKAEVPQDSHDSAQSKINPPSKKLLSIFPHEKDTTYIYNGFAEYGHVIEIDNVEEKEAETIYDIIGEVGDPSGGEAPGNFDIKLQYIVDHEKITEKIIQGERLPHKIPELQVLKLPLKTGSTWDQKIVIDGKEEILKAEIEFVRKDETDDTETYGVVYRVPMKDMPNEMYEERRVFKRGVGLYSFENTIGKEYDFNFGYTLSFIDKE
ncbi:hypothetical protein QBE52_01805 [Clostridiaceae bacterium 35-E11]